MTQAIVCHFSINIYVANQFVGTAASETYKNTCLESDCENEPIYGYTTRTYCEKHKKIQYARFKLLLFS